MRCMQCGKEGPTMTCKDCNPFANMTAHELVEKVAEQVSELTTLMRLQVGINENNSKAIINLQERCNEIVKFVGMEKVNESN